ncbi:MAG: GreA/GreB family elongation factor [Phycisphaerales bacterium]
MTWMYEQIKDFFGESFIFRNTSKRYLNEVFKNGKPIVSEYDYLNILKASKNAKSSEKKYAKIMTKILDKADIRPLKLISFDIITMNSKILFVTNKGKHIGLKLVYPEHANKSKGDISVFSRLGICLLGKKKGHKIRKNYYIHEIIYQPQDKGYVHEA